MQKVTHGQAHFAAPVKQRVLELMRWQCSSKRSAYQAVHKRGLCANDIKKNVKKNYMAHLNARYVSDACTQASQIKDEEVIFGGKKAWKQLQTETLSKEEWLSKRNNQLYSRGERSHNGNANIRILKDKIFINDPSARGEWIEGKLYLDGDWDQDMYTVQIIYRNDKFEINVSWTAQDPIQIVTVPGAIGVDMNCDGVAVSEVDGDGNLLNHKYIRKQRIQFAEENKRQYDINQLAKETVDLAGMSRKPIVVEKIKLSQKKRKSGNKKARRKKSNFANKKIVAAIKSRAVKCGIPVIEVNPAYTSDLGLLKYKDMYSLGGHDAAALTIARRGLGIKERQTYTVTTSGSKKRTWNLEGRNGTVVSLSDKSYSWLNCGKFVRSKPANLTGSSLAAEIDGLGSAIGLSVGVTPTGESCSITGRVGHTDIIVIDNDTKSVCRVMKGILQNSL
jgi:IS605 OrfB family transposase